MSLSFVVVFVFLLCTISTIIVLMHVGTLASTPGQILAFTSNLAKIRPGIDCMLKNKPPSLIDKTLEVVPRVSQANMSKLQKQQSSLTARA